MVTQKRGLTDTWLFFRNFIKDPIQNGSIIPSSTIASRQMLRGIDFSKVDVLVELGPGNGVITEQIVRKCHPKTKLILLEIEDSFVQVLRRRFANRVIIENVSAHLLDKVLQKHHITKVDVLISGLPFPRGKQKEELFKTIKSLTDRGTIFRFFTYFPSIMKKVYKKLPVKRKSCTFMNIPPMWIYGIN